MDIVKNIPYTSGGNELLDPVRILGRLELSSGMSVGDFGCGRIGHFVFPAASIVGRSGTVYAIDILKPVLEGIEAKARREDVLNIKTIWSNIEIFRATSIPDGALDAAFLINVLFQTKNPLDAIEEAARTVRSGGKILAVDWRKTGSHFGPSPERRIEKSRIEELMAGLSLNKIDDFEAGDYHYGVIFQK